MAMGVSRKQPDVRRVCECVRVMLELKEGAHEFRLPWWGQAWALKKRKKNRGSHENKKKKHTKSNETKPQEEME